MATRGTGRVYQRGATWWMDYSAGGIRFRESTGTTVKSEAIARLKEKLGQAAAGAIVAANPTMDVLLDAVVLDYRANQRKSLDDTINRVDALKKRWGKVLAKKFGASQIQMHISERMGDVSPATINRELSIFNRAFVLAIERRQVAHKPVIHKLQEHNARQGFFSDDEFRRLRAALPEWMRMLVTFAYFTGCRKSEILAIRWRQVDLKEGVVKLGKTKNGHPRTVPLTSELRAMFEMAKSQPGRGELVFERDGRAITEFEVYEPWAEACAAVELEGRLFHDFRRTGVRNMVRAGVPRHIAMAISGHKTDSMFRRYDIVDERDLRSAAAKIDAYINDQQSEVAQSAAQTLEENRKRKPLTN